MLRISGGAFLRWVIFILVSATSALPARADEMWIASTSQQDLGGMGIGSNGFWPVTPVGAVRFAWAVPNDLQLFQSAKLVLIPHAGGASTLNIFVCAAQDAAAVLGNCSSLSSHPFTGIANQLVEVDVSAALAPRVGTAGTTYVALLAFTLPTTTTDHILGLRFAYDPVPATGTVGTDATNVALGSYALGNSPTGGFNTAVGQFALASNRAGSSNTAVGDGAMLMNGSGFGNTAIGKGANHESIFANNNTSLGANALGLLFSGDENTAVGAYALQSHADAVFSANTAVGYLALNGVRSFNSDNTALGHAALSLVQGSGNIGIGKSAGIALMTGSNNIYVGHQGLAAESNTVRLGTAGTQGRTFVAGIRGVTTDLNNAIPMVIDANGQLGTLSSSRRVKEDIHDMADASRRLLQLRPVTFRYTRSFGDGSKPVQFGLIAEEVAEVFPELAVRNASGEVETVHYETLSVLLLNELQHQEQRLEALEQRLGEWLNVFQAGSNPARP